MTFPCNTKLFPLQPEIKYMSMETIYLGIVIFLFVLAIFDLVVGVSNDAVNFLQSAVGAKAASFKTILFIAGIGVFIGAALSNGMMDIARHGIYQPEHFYFAEIMCILLAVMLTDVVLLDVFNTMGMPTSTTVSMVFELLGGTFALALIKVYNSDTLGLGDLINTDKALSVIMAIFVSTVVSPETRRAATHPKPERQHQSQHGIPDYDTRSPERSDLHHQPDESKPQVPSRKRRVISYEL